MNTPCMETQEGNDTERRSGTYLHTNRVVNAVQYCLTLWWLCPTNEGRRNLHCRPYRSVSIQWRTWSTRGGRRFTAAMGLLLLLLLLLLSVVIRVVWFVSIPTRLLFVWLGWHDSKDFYLDFCFHREVARKIWVTLICKSKLRFLERTMGHFFLKKNLIFSQPHVHTRCRRGNPRRD